MLPVCIYRQYDSICCLFACNNKNIWTPTNYYSFLPYSSAQKWQTNSKDPLDFDFSLRIFRPISELY